MGSFDCNKGFILPELMKTRQVSDKLNNFDISVKLGHDYKSIQYDVAPKKKNTNHETGYVLDIFFSHKKPPGIVIEERKCYLCT